MQISIAESLIDLVLSIVPDSNGMIIEQNSKRKVMHIHVIALKTNAG
jgi:hypothetical protein